MSHANTDCNASSPVNDIPPSNPASASHFRPPSMTYPSIKLHENGKWAHMLPRTPLLEQLVNHILAQWFQGGNRKAQMRTNVGQSGRLAEPTNNDKIIPIKQSLNEYLKLSSTRQLATVCYGQLYSLCTTKPIHVEYVYKLFIKLLEKWLDILCAFNKNQQKQGGSSVNYLQLVVTIFQRYQQLYTYLSRWVFYSLNTSYVHSTPFQTLKGTMVAVWNKVMGDEDELVVNSSATNQNALQAFNDGAINPYASRAMMFGQILAQGIYVQSIGLLWPLTAYVKMVEYLTPGNEIKVFAHFLKLYRTIAGQKQLTTYQLLAPLPLNLIPLCFNAKTFSIRVLSSIFTIEKIIDIFLSEFTHLILSHLLVYILEHPLGFRSILVQRLYDTTKLIELLFRGTQNKLPTQIVEAYEAYIADKGAAMLSQSKVDLHVVVAFCSDIEQMALEGWNKNPQITVITPLSLQRVLSKLPSLHKQLSQLINTTDSTNQDQMRRSFEAIFRHVQLKDEFINDHQQYLYYRARDFQSISNEGILLLSDILLSFDEERKKSFDACIADIKEAKEYRMAQSSCASLIAFQEESFRKAFGSKEVHLARLSAPFQAWWDQLAKNYEQVAQKKKKITLSAERTKVTIQLKTNRGQILLICDALQASIVVELSSSTRQLKQLCRMFEIGQRIIIESVRLMKGLIQIVEQALSINWDFEWSQAVCVTIVSKNTQKEITQGSGPALEAKIVRIVKREKLISEQSLISKVLGGFTTLPPTKLEIEQALKRLEKNQFISRQQNLQIGGIKMISYEA